MTDRFARPQILAASILLFAASSVAEAATVFTNFGPGLSYDINSGNPVGNAFDGNDYAEANSFVPTGSGSLQSLRIALSCAFACPGPVGVSLTTDTADHPGLVLESFVVPGGTLGPIGTNNSPLFLLSVLHPALIMGTKYWVAVGAGLTDTAAWNLNTTGDLSDQAISTDGGSTWFSPSGNTPGALAVEAEAVPEPGTSRLLVTGALMLTLVFQRWRAAQRGAATRVGALDRRAR
jgi:hypothetical protein